MCMITRMQRPLTAAQDIVCYKVVYDNTFASANWPMFRSLYFKYNYVFNGKEVRTTDFSYKLQGWVVNRGFHSYTDLGYATGVCRMGENPNRVLLECVIPKGASYYVSEGGKEYCSDRIKITGWKHYDEKNWRR